MERKEELRDKQIRKNNVVIKGLETIGDSPEKTVKDFLSTEMGMRDCVKEVTPIRKAGKIILLAVKMTNSEAKKHFMMKKNNVNLQNITIRHDSTFAEREMQREIHRIAKSEEAKGHAIKIGFGRLWINDTAYIWKEGVGLTENFRRNQADSS